MRIAITTVQAPFLKGGAELHANGLQRALMAAGHEAEIVTMPFRFDPPSEVLRNMDMWAAEDLGHMSGPIADRVIALRFPTWYAKHHSQAVWALHQHRGVYELWDEQSATPESKKLRDAIIARDSEALNAIPTHLRFANSRNVANRMLRYNLVQSTPLYHPPATADELYCAPAQPYIFFPSRLESLKRQDLLIEAMALVKSPIVSLLSGAGGQQQRYAKVIERHGLQNKVRLLGEVDHHTLLALFAKCSAVYFGPFDEDYGYVTLEAMLAKKPVITCTDSGGPLEFVLHEQTGYICEPTAQAIADAIERVASDPQAAQAMGIAGYERYQSLNITWDNVVQKLTA
jgi:glycosyltransferase involved in cell wall biosynthesis